MASPCNNLNLVPIKVSQLVRYKNLDSDDIILTVESGSKLYSRRSTIADLKNSLGRLTGSYSGSFTGSFKGKASGSFSGSYWGSVISKKTNASGSFSGSYWGSVISKKTIASGSFSGSIYGKLVSKNTKASGSFSGSYWGSVISKNTIASGSFSGSTYGKLVSKNTKASGSFSGSYWGSVISKNTKASGSFNGNIYGKVIGSNGSLITGSFRGIDNITNFKGTGKKVSYNGTASYAVSASYSATASYLSLIGGGSSPLAFAFASWTGTSGGITALSKYNIGSITRVGTQPTVASQNPSVYCDVVFTTPCVDANYTVLSYCSWNNPSDISNGGTEGGIGGASAKFEADLGTSVVSNRTNTGFRVTVFTGWHAGTAGDGDDYYYNTAQFPDYNSFVVFR